LVEGLGGAEFPRLSVIALHVQAAFIAPVALSGRHPDKIGAASPARKEHMMIRSIMLSATLAFGLATAASAGITPSAVGNADSLVVRVAEECGAGMTRGPDGHCHPMAEGKGCPAGTHLGPDGKRCQPN
jgi:hypothetical protein